MTNFLDIPFSKDKKINIPIGISSTKDLKKEKIEEIPSIEKNIKNKINITTSIPKVNKIGVKEEISVTKPPKNGTLIDSSFEVKKFSRP